MDLKPLDNEQIKDHFLERASEPQGGGYATAYALMCILETFYSSGGISITEMIESLYQEAYAANDKAKVHD
jgi:hypothetical protein